MAYIVASALSPTLFEPLSVTILARASIFYRHHHAPEASALFHSIGVFRLRRLALVLTVLVLCTDITLHFGFENKCLKNTYTHTYTHTHIIDPRLGEREWHRMTRMTRPDCAVMCNLINTHTHTHTKNPPPLSRLIRGFRNKYH